MSTKISENSLVEPLRLGNCTCDSPAKDPIAYELPDGTSIRIVACVECGGATSWEINQDKQVEQQIPENELEELRDELKKARAKVEHLKIRVPEHSLERSSPLQGIVIDRLLTYLLESRSFIAAQEANPSTLVNSKVALLFSKPSKKHRYRTGRPTEQYHLLYQGCPHGNIVNKLLCKGKHKPNLDVVDTTSYDLRDARLCKSCLSKKLTMIDKRNVARGVKNQMQSASLEG